jgi:hypothetical protein
VLVSDRTVSANRDAPNTSNRMIVSVAPLPLSGEKWKNASMNVMARLPVSTDCRGSALLRRRRSVHSLGRTYFRNADSLQILRPAMLPKVASICEPVMLAVSLCFSYRNSRVPVPRLPSLQWLPTATGSTCRRSLTIRKTSRKYVDFVGRHFEDQHAGARAQ